jgi:hypothetical protein
MRSLISIVSIGCKQPAPDVVRLWPVGLQQEPALGAHLATPRLGYTHHGIYAGRGKVVQYTGLSRSWISGPVEEVTLARFAHRHVVRVVDHPESTYSAEEIVLRARSRVGENAYRLLTNNCEHFCHWCVSGESRSPQVARSLTIPTLALSHAVHLAARVSRMLALPPGAVGRRGYAH